MSGEVKATKSDVRAATRTYQEHCREHKCPEWWKLNDQGRGDELCAERVRLLNESRRIAMLWNVPAD
jgi:hypothetical protein